MPPPLGAGFEAMQPLDMEAPMTVSTQTSPSDRADMGRRMLAWLGRPEVPSLIFLVVLLIALSIFTPGFRNLSNLRDVVEQVVVVSIVALAVNQVVIAGEIDVSTGSLVATCAFVYGNVALVVGGSWFPLVSALIVGAAIGATNGALSTYGRVPSIIATIGMLFILRGAVLLAGGAQVLNLSAASRIFGQGSLGGVPTSIVVLVVMTAAIELISRGTLFGRNIYAIGGNPRAARAIGLPVRKARLLTFVLSGVSCGLAAAVLLGQIGQLQATAATGLELRVIAAIVLGGTSIVGGRGSNAAPLIGAVLVGVILDALTLNRVSGTFELLVLGALILAAISFDGLRSRLTSSRI